MLRPSRDSAAQGGGGKVPHPQPPHPLWGSAKVRKESFSSPGVAGGVRVAGPVPGDRSAAQLKGHWASLGRRGRHQAGAQGEVSS